MRRTTLPYICIALSSCAVACTLEKTDDTAEFREALPRAEAVSVVGPESTAASAERRGLLAEHDAAPTEPAFWYAFTRNVRDGVNVVTVRVLGMVWLIVHLEPTEVGHDFAQWGPHTDALDPVTYRFRVERVSAERHEYRYVLEGRPKRSREEADYRAILTGTGYGQASEQHGDGTFTIDLDAARELDPVRHSKDSGVLTIDHDLPRDVTRRAPALPRVIEAHAETADGAWFSVLSEARADGTGSLSVDSRTDIDPTRTTALELVHVASRWRADGAGRADIVIEGGDLPAAVPVVTAVECWGTDFSRTHYADSVGHEPTFGDPSACVYPAAP